MGIYIFNTPIYNMHGNYAGEDAYISSIFK